MYQGLRERPGLIGQYGRDWETMYAVQAMAAVKSN